MGIRSTVKTGPAIQTETCHWQAEKLGLIEKIHLSNPQPRMVHLESGRGNDVVVVDERDSLTGNHKMWLALETLRHKLRGNALKPGMRVVQRGRAAAAMAFACARLGLPFIAILQDHASPSTRRKVGALGGEVVTARNDADAHDIEAGYIIRPGYTVIDPFSAEVRALPTRHSPGDRMLKACGIALGRMPSLVVTAVGTGTTANSVRLAASDRQLGLDIVGVDVAGGVLTDYVGLNLHGRTDKRHVIAGASPGYVPPSFIRTSVDRFQEVRPEAAIATCHLFRDEFDVEMGPSSGMALFGALNELHGLRERRQGQLIATFCYDHGQHYADTIFNAAFLKEQGLEIAPWRETLERLIADLK